MYGLQKKVRINHNGINTDFYQMVDTSTDIEVIKKKIKEYVLDGSKLSELYLVKQIPTTIEMEVQTYENLERGNENEKI
ncbi:MAG TPA: hypothetical protein VFC79_12765 [Tissierellaceae bacterium]|nr:hypothetical protein [Tissierellaceae bacterium]